MPEILTDDAGQVVDTRMEGPFRFELRYFAKDREGAVHVLVAEFPNGQTPTRAEMDAAVVDAKQEVGKAGLDPLSKVEFWDHLCATMFKMRLSIVGGLDWEERP